MKKKCSTPKCRRKPTLQMLGDNPLCRKCGDDKNRKSRERSAQRRAEGHYSPSIKARWSDAKRSKMSNRLIPMPTKKQKSQIDGQRFKDERDSALKMVEMLRDALKDCEQATNEYGPNFCPSCDFPVAQGHAHNCKLAAALSSIPATNYVSLDGELVATLHEAIIFGECDCETKMNCTRCAALDALTAARLAAKGEGKP